MLDNDIKDNIIGIISYCDTHEKLRILVDNINIIKNNYSEFKIAIHANYPLPEYVQMMVNHYFYEDLNVISDKIFDVWRVFPFFNKKFFYRLDGDYGFSVFQQIKSLTKKLIDYDRILLINYDLLIEKKYIDNHFNLKNDLIIYGDKDIETGKEGCYLLLMSFNPVEFLNKVVNLLTYQSYLDIVYEIPENYFYFYVKKSGIDFIRISYDVKDRFSTVPYYAFKNDFFNENCICFNNNNLEIYLWFNQKMNNITIRIDNIYDFLIQNKNIYDAFEGYLNYSKEISDIKIIKIDDTEIVIPLNIIKNAWLEDL